MTLKAAKKTSLALGNLALRNGNYSEAVLRFLTALLELPDLQRIISLNLVMARERYRASRKNAEWLRVAICGCEASPHPVERVNSLARFYLSVAEVEIIGCVYPQGGSNSRPWDVNLRCARHTFIVDDESLFIAQAIQLVMANPYDIVHLSQPLIPNIIIGLLYKIVWNSRVLIDIDDEGPGSSSRAEALSVQDYLLHHGKLPGLSTLTEKPWTRIAFGMAADFDAVTVSTPDLQERFGGALIGKMQNDSFSTTISSIVTQTGDTDLTHSPNLQLFIKGLADPTLMLLAGVPLARTGTSVTLDDLKLRASSAELVRPENLEPYFFDLIKNSGLFDQAWYLKQYKSKHQISGNPLAHYLNAEKPELMDPSQAFSTSYYLESNPDLAASPLHPFLHYVAQGINENRKPLPPPPVEYVSRYSVAAPVYIPRLQADAPPVEKAVKVIAFYLPQFHAIPENDKWWGTGFTEWSNVQPATPKFAGHYQPHVPDDYLGYYNLLNRETQAKQVELAKQYGIEGFCFYAYWFTGRRLLEQPLDQYLDNPKLDLPFCVCWANENWSRRWDGLDSDLLMTQHYSDEDDISFIENFAKYLRDPRYIRINGRPLLLVYRPNLFPSMRATAKRWRDWCRNNEIGEIYLAYPLSFENNDPADYGFDAGIEFPPNNSSPPQITHTVEPVVSKFESIVYDWRIFVERSDAYQDPGYTLFRSATPAWDNTARKRNKGTVFQNSCPLLFQKWLTNAFKDTLGRYKNPDEQIVFINAWNEWAEGAHLEPDKKYGYAWLQAVRDAHKSVYRKQPRIVLVSHDAHPHGAQILCLNLARYYKEKFHFEIDLILLGQGRLLPKYAEYAAVHQISQSNVPELINEVILAIRSKGAEIAIVNTTVSGWIIPYLKKHDFSVVSLVHEMPGILKQYALQSQASHIADLADKVVFPAQQVKGGFEEFVGKSLKQAVIRPQGLYLRSLLRSGADKESIRKEVRAKLGIEKKARIIMCAGYADHRKGFDLFVLSCLRVMEEVPHTHALWVGHLDQQFVDASLMPAVLAGRKKQFLFTGLVEHPQEYYLAADIYALTSREDPFPSVVMEALDALTPVVAFKDSGGFENLLKRDCGVLVAKENCEDYAAAMSQLLQNPEYALSLATTGQKIVETELNFRHYLFDLLEFADYPLPKVSVVVPNYNYEQYIHERLNTVESQTHPIYELIVLDDVSKDNSIAVIQTFLRTSEIPFSFFANTKNSGSVFKQWQKGVETARGDLVWIAEADDLAEPTFLETLVDCFVDPEVVLAFSQSKQINEDGHPLANDYLEYTKDVGPYWEENYVIDGVEEVKRALCIKNTIPNVSGVLFKTSHIKAVLSQHIKSLIKQKVAGDWLVYLLMAEKGKFAFCARSLNVHRRHSGSVTKRNNHLNEVIGIHDYIKSEFALPSTMSNAMDMYTIYLSDYFK